jgi:glutaryl-CoA dehydrogenase (non-decarboxylating)
VTMTIVRDATLVDEFLAFATDEVAPHARAHDRDQRLAPEVIDGLRRRGLLASFLPRPLGGRGLDMVGYGALHEAIGAVCSSTRSLITVHDMVTQLVWRFGTEAQRARWLPDLATGRTLAAFALTEPEAGATATVQARAERRDDRVVLSGTKKWISFGQLAGVFLVFAREPAGVTALLVDRDAPGLTVRPVRDLLGARGSMLAELDFDGVTVRADRVIGRPGRAAPQLTVEALTVGRLGVGAGSVGIVQGCLDVCVDYVRHQRPALAGYQLIQRMLAGMVTDVEAGRGLWVRAARLHDAGDPAAAMAAMVAKHFAAGAAARASRDAVQVLGANGCLPEHRVERLFRDAKIMEIIEGSTEVHELTLGAFGYADQRGSLTAARPTAAPRDDDRGVSG